MLKGVDDRRQSRRRNGSGEPLVAVPRLWRAENYIVSQRRVENDRLLRNV